jgi:hypothetical protein
LTRGIARILPQAGPRAGRDSRPVEPFKNVTLAMVVETFVI